MNSESTEVRRLFVERAFIAKTYDIDFAGHVSNITYVRWLEDLRLAILDEFFPLQQQMEQGYGPVLLRTEIDYKSAIRLFEPVVGQMWATGAGVTRMGLEAVFTVGERVCARAHHVSAMISLSDGRPIRLPPELRAMIDPTYTQDS